MIELMRFALRSPPPVVPPPPETVFAIPPVPAFGRTPTFCRSGEERLTIVEETARGNRAGGEGSSRRRPLPDVRRIRKKSSQSCNMFAATVRFKWRDFIYAHGSPRADSSVPAALSVGGGGISAAAGAGSRALVPRADIAS